MLFDYILVFIIVIILQVCLEWTLFAKALSQTGQSLGYSSVTSLTFVQLKHDHRDTIQMFSVQFFSHFMINALYYVSMTSQIDLFMDHDRTKPTMRNS